MSPVEAIGIFAFAFAVLLISDILLSTKAYIGRWKQPSRLFINVVLAAFIVYILNKLI